MILCTTETRLTCLYPHRLPWKTAPISHCKTLGLRSTTCQSLCFVQQFLAILRTSHKIHAGRKGVVCNTVSLEYGQSTNSWSYRDENQRTVFFFFFSPVSLDNSDVTLYIRQRSRDVVGPGLGHWKRSKR